MAFFSVLLYACIQFMLPSMVSDEPVRVEKTASVNRGGRNEENLSGSRAENRAASSLQKNKRKSNQVRQLFFSIFTLPRPSPKKNVDSFLFALICTLFSSFLFSRIRSCNSVFSDRFELRAFTVPFASFLVVAFVIDL